MSSPPHFRPISGRDPNSLRPPETHPAPQTVGQAKNWALTYLYKRYGARAKIVWRGCDNRSHPQRVAAYLAQYAALSCVINGESKWNPAAVNKHSGACGLIQWNPCRKLSSALPNWRTRPVDQVKLAMAYTLRRYGSPLREQQSRAGRGWM